MILSTKLLVSGIALAGAAMLPLAEPTQFAPSEDSVVVRTTSVKSTHRLQMEAYQVSNPAIVAAVEALPDDADRNSKILQLFASEGSGVVRLIRMEGNCTIKHSLNCSGKRTIQMDERNDEGKLMARRTHNINSEVKVRMSDSASGHLATYLLRIQQVDQSDGPNRGSSMQHQFEFTHTIAQGPSMVQFSTEEPAQGNIFVLAASH